MLPNTTRKATRQGYCLTTSSILMKSFVQSIQQQRYHFHCSVDFDQRTFNYQHAFQETHVCTKHQNISMKLKCLRYNGVNVTQNAEASGKSVSNEDMERLVHQLSDTPLEYTEWKRIEEGDKKKMKIVKINTSEANNHNATAVLTILDKFMPEVKAVFPPQKGYIFELIAPPRSIAISTFPTHLQSLKKCMVFRPAGIILKLDMGRAHVIG